MRARTSLRVLDDDINSSSVRGGERERETGQENSRERERAIGSKSIYKASGFSGRVGVRQGKFYLKIVTILLLFFY